MKTTNVLGARAFDGEVDLGAAVQRPELHGERGVEGRV